MPVWYRVQKIKLTKIFSKPYHSLKVLKILVLLIIIFCYILFIGYTVLGENINLSWSPDGQTIAVGNKEDLITFIDVRTSKTKSVEQFKLEVNEFSWNKDGSLFFLTTGQGSIIIHRLVAKGTCVSL